MGSIAANSGPQIACSVVPRTRRSLPRRVGSQAPQPLVCTRVSFRREKRASGRSSRLRHFCEWARAICPKLGQCAMIVRRSSVEVRSCAEDACSICNGALADGGPSRRAARVACRLQHVAARLVGHASRPREARKREGRRRLHAGRRLRNRCLLRHDAFFGRLLQPANRRVPGARRHRRTLSSGIELHQSRHAGDRRAGLLPGELRWRRRLPYRRRLPLLLARRGAHRALLRAQHNLPVITATGSELPFR